MATERATKKTGGRLDVTQRLALIQFTECNPGVCLSLPDENIDFEFFRRYKIPPCNLVAAKLGPAELKARGVSDPALMQVLGYDALHLANQSFCEACISSYGAASILDTFLRKPADAVALAGMPAAHMLNVTTEQMLRECAGASVEAAAVLKEQASLETVQATTLLDTGIRAKQLQTMGFTADRVRTSTGASALQMQKMGFP